MDREVFEELIKQVKVPNDEGRATSKPYLRGLPRGWLEELPLLPRAYSLMLRCVIPPPVTLFLIQ